MYYFVLLLYRFTYSYLPQLLKDVFSRQELEPGQLNHVLNKLANFVIYQGNCDIPIFASNYFSWPDYFIDGDYFKGSDKYKLNFFAVQCELNRLKGDFISFKNIIENSPQASEIKDLVRKVTQRYSGSKEQLIENVHKSLCRKDNSCVWTRDFFLNLAVSCYASLYARDYVDPGHETKHPTGFQIHENRDDFVFIGVVLYALALSVVIAFLIKYCVILYRIRRNNSYNVLR
ncbi:hypothetical protein RF11_06267 [Thelohanellus kitauei]|uniref:Uncharacterized protein n=1 Tax=Thelohanellus kitauei TaxID=669202 RepID=A0A0C2MNY3_THEKT|nr:hypothetical protein RF11_06267 [Thelohanellus kitauei]